jgi:LCP family protein required for cell wall assembly
MSPTATPPRRGDKPYRRFRARDAGDGGGIDDLRRLTEAERGRGGDGRGGAPPARRSAAPEGPRIPRADDRRRERAMARAGRPWWSPRGVSPAGWAVRGVVAVLVLFAVWAVGGYLALRGAVSESNGRITASAKAALSPTTGGMLTTPTDILIVGSDARPGETRSRADTILIMRVDPDAGRIKYLSVPRDTRIQSGPLAGNKINESFYYAGQAGLIRNVRNLTGIPIHHIMVVNFKGFPKTVDDLGGVDVTNPTRLEDCPYPGGRTVSFARGHIHLNGAQALEYVRVRKCDGDFERARRQQAFMAALKSEVASPMSAWRAPWSGAAIVRTLSTDMGVGDLVKLGWLQWRLKQDPEDRYLLPGSLEMIGGRSFVVLDPAQAAEPLRRFMAS